MSDVKHVTTGPNSQVSYDFGNTYSCDYFDDFINLHWKKVSSDNIYGWHIGTFNFYKKFFVGESDKIYGFLYERFPFPILNFYASLIDPLILTFSLVVLWWNTGSQPLWPVLPN